MENTNTQPELTNELRAQNEMAKAAQCRQDAQESFDRCDTDGFVSQWASGIMAGVHTLQAEIERAGGVSEFHGLYQGTRRVAAKIITTAYGNCWILRNDEAETFGRKFIPLASGSTGKSRVQKQLGLCERPEMAPAKAKVMGTGRGLSGSAWAARVRCGDEWGLDAILCPE
jgi:hypothetical protein